MSNQLKVEWFKLRRNRTFWTLALTVTALSALLHYLVIIDWWHMDDTAFDRAGLSELKVMTFFGAPLFFNLLTSTLAGFMIANEFSSSSVIKNQVLSGSKRSQILLAKYAIFTLGSIVITILIPLAVVFVEVWILGAGDILTVSSWLYLGRSFGLFLLHFLSYTGIMLFLAIVTEESGKTILFSIVFSIIVFIIDQVPKSSLFQSVYEHSIFYQLSDVFKSSMTSGEIIQSILIAVGSIILILWCVMFVFNRKEIK